MVDFSNIVVVSANSEQVLVIFHMGFDGLVDVSEIRLSFRFHFRLESIHIDEKIFEIESRVLTYTIGKLPTTVEE